MPDTNMLPRVTKPTAKIWTYTKEQIDALPAVIGKEEVSHIAGVSTRTVVRYALNNRIAGAFRVGVQWRFNTELVLRQFGRLR